MDAFMRSIMCSSNLRLKRDGAMAISESTSQMCEYLL